MKDKDCKTRAFSVPGTLIVNVLVSGELRSGVFDDFLRMV